MGKFIARILFYLLAIVLVVWTGTRTVELLTRVVPNNTILPYIGLVVFEGGFLAWTIYFIYGAEGSAQRAVALLASIVDLVLVGVASGASLWLGGQTLAEVPADFGTLALWLIVIATFVNIAAVYLAHITDPSVRHSTRMKNAQDRIYEKAHDLLDTRIDEMATRLATDMAEVMYQNVTATLHTGSAKPMEDRARLNGHLPDSVLLEASAQSLPVQPVPIEISTNGHAVNPTPGRRTKS